MRLNWVIENVTLKLDNERVIELGYYVDVGFPANVLDEVIQVGFGYRVIFKYTGLEVRPRLFVKPDQRD